MSNPTTNTAGSIEPRKGRRIIAAAILLQNGAVICGVRHFDQIMREVLEAWGHTSKGGVDKLVKGAEQGFVSNDYQFVNREEAWVIALRAGQFDPKNATGTQGTLYSEDLW